MNWQKLAERAVTALDRVAAAAERVAAAAERRNEVLDREADGITADAMLAASWVAESVEVATNART